MGEACFTAAEELVFALRGVPFCGVLRLFLAGLRLARLRAFWFSLHARGFHEAQLLPELLARLRDLVRQIRREAA